MFRMFNKMPVGVYCMTEPVDGGDSAGNGGGGSSGESGQQDAGGSDSDYEARIADFRAQLDRANGDATKLAERLHVRAYGLRKRAQEAEAKVPPEDAIVLDGEEKIVYDKYKALGLSADEIAGQLAEFEQLKRGQRVWEVAEAAGYNPKVLSRILPEGAVIGIDNTSGTENPTPYIEVDKNKIPLSDWVKNNRSDFLPALAVSDTGGRQWIKQTASAGASSGGSTSLVRKRLDERKARQPEKPPI